MAEPTSPHCAALSPADGLLTRLQATLVTQFLCCIPLATVEAVLAWLKPQVPEEEQQELLAQVRREKHDIGSHAI